MRTGQKTTPKSSHRSVNTVRQFLQSLPPDECKKVFLTEENYSTSMDEVQKCKDDISKEDSYFLSPGKSRLLMSSSPFKIKMDYMANKNRINAYLSYKIMHFFPLGFFFFLKYLS